MTESRSSIFFNAQHAPIGAFSSFTLGAKGACGGLGMEIGGPANEDVFIGVESASEPGAYHALPFFGGALPVDDTREFDVESLSQVSVQSCIQSIPDSQICRKLEAGIDTWTAGDLEFRIISPVRSVPDPAWASPEALRAALVPAVLAELTIDNRQGARARKAFFGYAGSNRRNAMQAWKRSGMVGVSQGPIAIASKDPSVYSGAGFQPEAVLEPRSEANLRFLLGRVGLLVAAVPAGERKTFRFAVSFFREGNVTSGRPSRYLYQRLFSNADGVLEYALGHGDSLIAEAETFDCRLAALSEERRLMLAQAIRSYYGSTQCLELADGSPAWIVNEGEYRMMNTLDLMIDQSFFELEMNPWTVRNQLDLHQEWGLYRDDFGIAFTHDLGVANTFSDAGRSAYELAGLKGCFSYMSCEELVNWTLAACLYGLRTRDQAWLSSKADLLEECLQSISYRDNLDPRQRDGVMAFDSARCEGGSEITTYDSLDASLGLARGNLYLAVKTWAAYVLLGRTLGDLGRVRSSAQAVEQAERCARTVANSARSGGILPAVLGADVQAKIIPAIEGLAFVMVAGLPECLSKPGTYGGLISALARHFQAVMASGECRFSDGGWRLSSTSRNSWLSKIYLCQFVAERLFRDEPDAKADRAHLGWLMRKENAYFAWSDQMLEGVAVGSRYYPRGVTGFLWLLDDLPEWKDEPLSATPAEVLL